MAHVQVSFRLDEKVNEDFSAKIKELGISKQSFYERAIDNFLNDSVADGSNTVAVGSQDVEKVVMDNLQSLAELVAKDGSFASAVALLLKDNLNVASDDLADDSDPVLPKLNDENLSADGVIDEDNQQDKPRKKGKWLILADLPLKPTLREIEVAFDIPETYLSKYKDKPEKLSRWEEPLSKLVLTSTGYENPYSRSRYKLQGES